MDRRSFLKHVARATAVAGTAAGWPAANTAAAVRAAAAGGLPPNAQSGPAPAIAPDAGSSAAAPAPSGTLTLVGAGDCILSRRVRDVKDPDFVFLQGETSRYAPAEDYAGVGLDIHTADPAAILRRIGFAKQRRFWQSVLPRLTFDRDRLASVELFPLTLGFENPPYQRGTPRLARGPEAAAILGTLAALSAPYGTVIDIQEGVGRVRLP